MRSVAIVSGGMDSVTLAYKLAFEGDELHMLSFDYGQRHAKELEFAGYVAQRLSARHDVIDLRFTALIGSSALTGPQDVPDGHYAKDTMSQTVVPNRNMMMLSIAAAVAISEGADRVVTGVHAGDHFIYPDCRPEFIDACCDTVLIGNRGFTTPGFRGIEAPFLYMSKTEIAALGERLGVPWELTWSCYKGGAVHCGRCGTCVERQEAMHEALIDDPTEYQDTEYWKTARP